MGILHRARCQKGGMMFLEKDSNVKPVLAWKCKYSQFLQISVAVI